MTFRNLLPDFKNSVTTVTGNSFIIQRTLLLAISIEAAELNELFLWKTTEESELVDRNKLKEELADILAFSLLLAGKHGFDVKEIVLEKIRKNNEKYPVEKSKGTAKKYNEL